MDKDRGGYLARRRKEANVCIFIIFCFFVGFLVVFGSLEFVVNSEFSQCKNFGNIEVFENRTNLTDIGLYYNGGNLRIEFKISFDNYNQKNFEWVTRNTIDYFKKPKVSNYIKLMKFDNIFDLNAESFKIEGIKVVCDTYIIWGYRINGFNKFTLAKPLPESLEKKILLFNFLVGTDIPKI